MHLCIQSLFIYFQADTLAVKAAMISAFDMMNLVEKSVTCLLPKV